MKSTFLKAIPIAMFTLFCCFNFSFEPNYNLVDNTMDNRFALFEAALMCDVAITTVTPTDETCLGGMMVL